MSRVVAQFTDEDGQEYLVLEDPDDDLRNAPPVRRYHRDEDPRDHRGESPRRTTSLGRNPRAVPVRSGPRERRPVPTSRGGIVRAQPVEVVEPARDPMTAKTAKILDFVEVFTDGVAELIPLPDKPPTPTGEVAADLANQNEHHQALHAHRVLTSRIRTSGRVLSKVFRLLLD